MTKKLSLLCLWLFSLQAFAQQNAGTASQLNQQFNTYLLNNIQRKLYVQTNSNVFTPGDTIWLKTTLVNALNHRAMDQEQVYYIDLVSPTNKVAVHQGFAITGGISDNQIALPALLKPGKYKLTAYTNYMRNFDPKFLFQKEIEIRADAPQTNWEFKAQVTPFEGGDSVEVRLQALSSRPTAFNEAINIKIQLAGGQIFGTQCQLVNNVGGISFVVPDSLRLPQALLTIQTDANTENPERIYIPLSTTRPDLQFLPEGGQLVAGLPNKVAFRAVDRNGQPVKLQGMILNNQQEAISSFSTSFQGMGTFNFIPREQEDYTALVHLGDSIFSFPLPAIQADAYGLQYQGEDLDNFYFAALQHKIEGKDFLLIAHTRGLVQFIASGKLDSTSTELAIPKAKFPSGIACFTLFVDEIPTAERLLYVDNPADRVYFNIDYSPQVAHARQQIDLSIKAQNAFRQPVTGNFSLVAYDEGRDQSIDRFENLRNYFNFTSDLQGDLLPGELYFNPTDPEANEKRELLLLTRGWRRFSWSEILAEKQAEKPFKIEKGLYIDGQISRLNSNKPVPKNFEISIVLKHPKFVHVDKAYTNDSGYFHLDLPAFTDSASLTIQTRNRTDSQRDYHIVLTSNLNVQEINAREFEKVSLHQVQPLVRNTALVAESIKTRSAEKTTPKELEKQPAARQRVDNYYFPGKDTILIQEVEARSNYLNKRDSMINATGQPDVIIESAQLQQLTEERSWYASIWDLLQDQIPGLQITQGPYDKRKDPLYNHLILSNPCNLVISNLSSFEISDTSRYSQQAILGNRSSQQYSGFMDDNPAVFFRVRENPLGYLLIFIDGRILNNSNIPLYDFFSYMDPSEIESINFIAKPKNYDTSLSLQANIDAGYVALADQDFGLIKPGLEANLAASPPAFLFITTKSKGGIFYKRAKGIETLYLSGLNMPRQFYSPKYEQEKANSGTNDFRKTLYWRPSFTTDSTGTAELSFFSSDSKNPIGVLVQGMTSNGNTGSAWLSIPVDNRFEPEPPIAQGNTPSTPQALSFDAIQLISGKITDSVSGEAVQSADISQLQPYYHETTNREGEFFLAPERLNKTEAVLISSPGYKSKQVTIDLNSIADLNIQLEPATPQHYNATTDARKIVSSAIRQSRTAYSSKESFQAYFRELVQVNGNTYGISESSANYSNNDWAGNLQSMRFETTRFKNMEDKNGHPVLILKPNHRREFYPLEADLLTVNQEFWQLENTKHFNYELVGEIEYGDETCYQIQFTQKEDLLQALQQGNLYIGKTSGLLRYASWSTSKNRRQYVSHVEYLHSNPMDYDVQLANDFYEASYIPYNDQLWLQSARAYRELTVNNQDKLVFDSQLSVVGKSSRDPKDIKQNSNADLLIKEEKANQMLVKDASYQIRPWLNLGIIKPEGTLLREASYMHDITVYPR